MHAPVMEPSSAVPTDTAAPTRQRPACSIVIDWSARNVFLVLLATLFLIGGGVYAVKHAARRAARPTSSDVQVIVTPNPGQAPQVVEDRSPIRSPPPCWRCRAPRWCAAFRSSARLFVYVIFEDGTDIY